MCLLFSYIMEKPHKRYVVRKGREPWIFSSRDACQTSILHYSGAKYKSFPTEHQAQEAFAKWTTTQQSRRSLTQDIIIPSISVDAACAWNPWTLERQGVDTATGKLLFHEWPFAQGTVNIGEFLALVQWLQWCTQHNKTFPLYSDSITAMARVRNQKAKTGLTPTDVNSELFDRLDQAHERLQHHERTNRILKRDTAQRGEIPADFGRK